MPRKFDSFGSDYEYFSWMVHAHSGHRGWDILDDGKVWMARESFLNHNGVRAMMAVKHQYMADMIIMLTADQRLHVLKNRFGDQTVLPASMHSLSGIMFKYGVYRGRTVKLAPKPFKYLTPPIISV